MNKMIKKLDELVASGQYSHDEIVEIEEATVMLVLGDIDYARYILNELGIVL